MSWRRCPSISSLSHIGYVFARGARIGYTPMELKQIKAFIDAMASSELTELHANKDGWTLRLVRGAGMPSRTPVSGSPLSTSAQAIPREPGAASAIADKPDTDVRAPLFGVVHLTPSPDASPFVVVGQAVKAGETLCVIEAMKVFNNICAERDGVVETVMATSGSEVEAGQLLMRIA
jgi:acetyl-CoA carboxylase biotin carboxyl carrier protein